MTPKKLETKALYHKVRDHLADEIAAGARKPGSTLPSETDLALELGVSLGTVRKALQMLEDEHLIMRAQGRGTFIRDESREGGTERFDRLRAADRTAILTETTYFQATSGPATAEEAHHLMLSADQAVIRTKRLRRREGVPFVFELASLPVDRFPGMVSESLLEPYEISALAQRFGVLVRGASEKLAIGRATSDVSKRLLVSEGSPLLRLDRTICSMLGEPIEWRISYCAARDVSYLAELK